MFTQKANDINQFLIQNKSSFSYQRGDEFVLPKFNVAIEEINAKIKTKTAAG